MPTASPAPALPRPREVYLFFALACALTWLADLPLALAWLRRATPPAYGPPLGALGAFGPTLAAVVVAARSRTLRAVFGRWRTNPTWIVVALLLPLALHLPATALEVALGGRPAHWFYPPVRPEHVAAMVVFAVGEEFGWRGFAYPRLEARHGPVVGSLILGAVWALWHLLMTVSPETGRFNLVHLAVLAVDLPLYSVICAWIFERGGRSMAVALAFHAGGHLDNVYRAPLTEVRLMIFRVVVVALVAALAARALARRRPAATAPLP
jgi:membrane protease YdiL (CAAX protease family)